MALSVKSLLEKYNNLRMTEQALIMIGVLAATYMLWDATLQPYIDGEKLRIENEKKQVMKDITTLENSIRDIAEKKQTDPNAQRRVTLFNLNKQVATLDEQLKRMTVGLITPKQMTDLVENLFTYNSGLTLKSLKSLDVKPLALDNDRTDVEDGGVYMHGMSIEFEGNYFNTLDYIKALEKLPWQLYWGGIEYKVTAYPLAHITLLVYTLSLSEGWIGT